MKVSNTLLNLVCRSVTLLMVAVSAMTAHGGSHSSPSATHLPYREPSVYPSETEFDPCLFSQAFSGCLNLRKLLHKTQQALVEEQKTVSQFRALMNIKNEQSRLYIAALNELNALRERLAECDVTNRTVNIAFSSTGTPDDLNSSHVDTSLLTGVICQAPETLLSGRSAYTDYAGQIQTMLEENKSLRLCITVKDGKLATSQ